jgi:hypothetical protein
MKIIENEIIIKAYSENINVNIENNQCRRNRNKSMKMDAKAASKIIMKSMAKISVIASSAWHVSIAAKHISIISK